MSSRRNHGRRRRPSISGLVGNVKAIGTIARETVKQVKLKRQISAVRSLNRVKNTNTGSMAPQGREAASELASRPELFDAQSRKKRR